MLKKQKFRRVGIIFEYFLVTIQMVLGWFQMYRSVLFSFAVGLIKWNSVLSNQNLLFELRPNIFFYSAILIG